MTTLTPAPIRLHATAAGYAIYGSDAEAAGPILGLAVEYDDGGFLARVGVPAAGLAAAVARLNAARETVAVVEGRRAA